MTATVTYAAAMPDTLPFDPDALREKYRAERDKRLRADGNEQYVEVAGRVRPLRRGPVRRADRARAADRRGRRRRHRRRLRRAARRRPAARGRRRRHPHHREGRRLRRHLVLEPLPGRDVRRRVVHLPAAARGDRLRPEGEVLPRARDPRAQPRRSGSTTTSTTTRCFQTEVTELRWDDADGALDRRAPTAATRMRARFVCMANGPLHRPKLPGIPGIETFEGHTFHTSRWDYDYTGGDSDGGPHRAARQAGRHHRHRRDRGAVRPAPRRGGRAPLRVPAHAVVDRRARQPPDRSRVGGVARARLAAAADGQLQQPRLRAGSRPRTWSTTAGPTSSASCS